MDLVRTDPDLGAEAKPHSVRHAGACVPEDACTVNTVLKALRQIGRGGENGVGMVRGVGVDVSDGKVYGRPAEIGGNGFDSEDKVEEFGREVFLCSVLEDSCMGRGEGSGEGCFRRGVTAEGNTFGKEGSGDIGEDGCKSGFINQKGFHGVARSRVAGFCVD